MKMGTEFWVGHVAAATLETILASDYWQRKLKAATVDMPKEISAHVQAAHASKFVALRVTGTVAAQQHSLCTLVLLSGMRLEMAALPSTGSSQFHSSAGGRWVPAFRRGSLCSATRRGVGAWTCYPGHPRRSSFPSFYIEICRSFS